MARPLRLLVAGGWYHVTLDELGVHGGGIFVRRDLAGDIKAVTVREQVHGDLLNESLDGGRDAAIHGFSSAEVGGIVFRHNPEAVENLRVGSRSGLHPLGCPETLRRPHVAGAVFQYCGSALLDLRMATRCCPQQGSHVVALRSFSFPSPLSCVRKCSGITRNRTRLLDCLAPETFPPSPSRTTAR
jgi:hypothetical protein